MAGFKIVVSFQQAADLTPELVAAEAVLFVNLTVLERETLLPAAIVGAQAAANALGVGPFVASFEGVDAFHLPGVSSSIITSVTTEAMVEIPQNVVLPDPAVAPVETPVVEPAPVVEDSPLSDTAATGEAPTDETVAAD